jgi:hypothetical protein
MNVGVVQVAMMIVGAAMGSLGLWLLFKGRVGSSREPLHLAHQPVPPAGLSVPTRLTLAIVSLIGGYSLVVWALPPASVGVQLNRHLWYVWVLLGMAVIGFSMWMDKFERRIPPSSGDSTR